MVTDSVSSFVVTNDTGSCQIDVNIQESVAVLSSLMCFPESSLEVYQTLDASNSKVDTGGEEAPDSYRNGYQSSAVPDMFPFTRPYP